MDNFRRGLHYNVEAGVKTSLAVPHIESKHENYLYITGSFLGPRQKAM
jgi:hypothetical protein